MEDHVVQFPDVYMGLYTERVTDFRMATTIFSPVI